MAEHLPARTLGPSPRVDRQHDALGSEHLGASGEEIGIRERSGVDRHLVGAVGQELRHVVDAANTAADRERNEDLVGRARDRIKKNGAMVRGSRDVEKDDLVRPLAVIEGSQLRGVAGVAQVLEANAFDDAAVIDVEARDYAFRRHLSQCLVPEVRRIFAAPAAGAKETTSTRGSASRRCVTERAQESTPASAPKAPGRLGQRRCKELLGQDTIRRGPRSFRTRAGRRGRSSRDGTACPSR